MKKWKMAIILILILCFLLPLFIMPDKSAKEVKNGPLEENDNIEQISHQEKLVKIPSDFLLETSDFNKGWQVSRAIEPLFNDTLIYDNYLDNSSEWSTFTKIWNNETYVESATFKENGTSFELSSTNSSKMGKYDYITKVTAYFSDPVNKTGSILDNTSVWTSETEYYDVRTKSGVVLGYWSAGGADANATSCDNLADTAGFHDYEGCQNDFPAETRCDLVFNGTVGTTYSDDWTGNDPSSSKYGVDQRYWVNPKNTADGYIVFDLPSTISFTSPLSVNMTLSVGFMHRTSRNADTNIYVEYKNSSSTWVQIAMKFLDDTADDNSMEYCYLSSAFVTDTIQDMRIRFRETTSDEGRVAFDNVLVWLNETQTNTGAYFPINFEDHDFRVNETALSGTSDTFTKQFFNGTDEPGVKSVALSTTALNMTYFNVSVHYEVCSIINNQSIINPETENREFDEPYAFTGNWDYFDDNVHSGTDVGDDERLIKDVHKISSGNILLDDWTIDDGHFTKLWCCPNPGAGNTMYLNGTYVFNITDNHVLPFDIVISIRHHGYTHADTEVGSYVLFSAKTEKGEEHLQTWYIDNSEGTSAGYRTDEYRISDIPASTTNVTFTIATKAIGYCLKHKVNTISFSTVRDYRMIKDTNNYNTTINTFNASNSFITTYYQCLNYTTPTNSAVLMLSNGNTILWSQTLSSQKFQENATWISTLSAEVNNITIKTFPNVTVIVTSILITSTNYSSFFSLDPNSTSYYSYYWENFGKTGSTVEISSSSIYLEFNFNHKANETYTLYRNFDVPWFVEKDSWIVMAFQSYDNNYTWFDILVSYSNGTTVTTFNFSQRTGFHQLRAEVLEDCNITSILFSVKERENHFSESYQHKYTCAIAWWRVAERLFFGTELQQRTESDMDIKSIGFAYGGTWIYFNYNFDKEYNLSIFEVYSGALDEYYLLKYSGKGKIGQISWEKSTLAGYHQIYISITNQSQHDIIVLATSYAIVTDYYPKDCDISFYDQDGIGFGALTTFKCYVSEQRFSDNPVIFQSSNERIRVYDYFNRKLYDQYHDWQENIDIMITIYTLIINNPENVSQKIVMTVEGITKNFTVPPQSSRIIRLIADDYTYSHYVCYEEGDDYMGDGEFTLSDDVEVFTMSLTLEGTDLLAEKHYCDGFLEYLTQSGAGDLALILAPGLYALEDNLFLTLAVLGLSVTFSFNLLRLRQEQKRTDLIEKQVGLKRRNKTGKKKKMDVKTYSLIRNFLIVLVLIITMAMAGMLLDIYEKWYFLALYAIIIMISIGYTIYSARKSLKSSKRR